MTLTSTSSAWSPVLRNLDQVSPVSSAPPSAGRGDLIRGVGVLLVLLVFIALVLAACGQMGMRSGTNLSKRVVDFGQPVPKGGGRYKVGDPYKINGRWYHPREDRTYDRVGVASWYGDLFHGRYTANGEIFDMDALSAAHPTLPMPVYARVTNLNNGRAIVVRINDRGPYAHDRIIDLSRRSAHLLSFKRGGTARVRVQYLGPAPLSGDDSYERRVLAQQSWGQVADASAPRNYVGRNQYRPARSAVRRKPPAVGAYKKTIAEATNPSVPLPERKALPERRIVTASIVKQPKAVTARLQPVSSAEPAQAKSEGTLFVQTGAFRVKANAERMRDQVAAIGTSHISPANVRGGVLYRVRLGPFPERRLATHTIERAAQAGIRGATIVGN